MALTADETQFIQGVSAGTGIDPRVLVAWIQSEGHPGDMYHNYMNIQTPTAASLGVPTSGTAAANTAEFSDVQTGIDATVKEIKSLGLSHLAHETPRQEITQIAASPWASSHYGGPGGPRLQSVFAGIFGGQAGLDSAYQSPSSSYQVGSTATTGSAADAGSVDITGSGGGPSVARAVSGLVSNPFKFLTSWRFVEVVGGFLLLLVGVALLARQFGLSVPTPMGAAAGAASDTFNFEPGEAQHYSAQPTSRPRKAKMQSYTLPADRPASRSTRTPVMSDSIPY